MPSSIGVHSLCILFYAHRNDGNLVCDDLAYCQRLCDRFGLGLVALTGNVLDERHNAFVAILTDGGILETRLIE
jgi:hypothetical protein